MKRRNFLILGTSFVSALAARTDNFKLIVQVTYKGSGTVDQTHKVFVALWDTPDFVQDGSQAAPVALKSLTAKTGSVEFDNVQKNPAYVSMLYDSSGNWDAASAPPAGTSLGLYATDDGAPSPITLEAGKTTTIKAQFDDSFKMK
jgi:hypothetical protein